MASRRAIVLDDDPDITGVHATVLEAMGFECSVHHSFASLVDAPLEDFDLMTLDLAMPGRDGLEVIDYLADRQITMPILLVSGMPDNVLHSVESVARHRGLNVAGAMRKPFWPEQLGKRVEAIMKAPKAHLLSNEQIDQLLDQTGGLVVEYLPQVHIKWHRYEGLQAHARLRHPEHGLIQPADFLPQLMRTDLKKKLSKKVVLRVLSDMQSWLDWDISPSVSINLGAPCLTDDSIIAHLVEAAAKFDVSLDRLRVEVADLLPTRVTSEVLRGMTRLRIKNVGVSMAGINGAAPSETFLRSLPIDEIKVDQSLVSRFESERKAEAVAERIVALSKTLQLQTVAQGVESPEQLKVIAELGFDVAQGPLFGKPRGAVQVPQLLSSKPRAY